MLHHCLKFLFLFFLITEGFSVENRGIVVKKKKRSSQQRTALVIGNSSYTGISALTNPVNDANDMEQALSNTGFKVVKVIDGSRDQINEAIFSFSKLLERADVGLFFYAGHAVQVEGVNYLVPVEADLEKKYQLKSQCIQVNDVLGAMEDANNKCNIVILDACRNNPFKGLTRSANRGLARMNSPRGSLLVYATQPGGVASDGKSRNGVYTQSLLRHMKTPNLEIMTLLRRVRNDVLDATEETQMPWESSSLTGDFYFSTNSAGVAMAPPPPTQEMGGEVQDAKKPQFGKRYRVTSLLMDLAPISKGSFTMGSRDFERNEMPPHEVSFSKDFWMSKYEVTQLQYKTLMGNNPSTIKRDQNPVETVTWLDAMKFCEKLTRQEIENLPEGYEFRLPTEAEWEYCCKAGKDRYTHDDVAGITWHKYNSKDSHQRSGQKSSNPWGLYDMLGNVWEWVYDSYDSNFYSRNQKVDPFCSTGKEKVIRGGSWYDLQRFCRPGNRNHYDQEISGDILGFRIVLAPAL